MKLVSKCDIDCRKGKGHGGRKKRLPQTQFHWSLPIFVVKRIEFLVLKISSRNVMTGKVLSIREHLVGN